MTVDAEPDPPAGLYDELKDDLRGLDRDAAIKAYYELLSSGRSLGEPIGSLAPDHVAKTKSDRHSPIQAPLVEQAASPPSDPAVSEDVIRSLPQRLEPSRLWRLVLIGSLIGIGVILVNDTSLHSKVVVAIRKTTEWMTFSTKPTTTASAKREPIFVGTKSQSSTPRPSKSEAASSHVTTTALALAPSRSAAAAARPHIASPAPAKQDGTPAHPSPSAPLKSAEASSHITTAVGAPAPGQPLSAGVSSNLASRAKTKHPGPGPSEIEAKALVSHGDALLGVGDLTSARLFYRYGADLGDGAAALRLGETFDPAFLRLAGLGPMAGDPRKALYWYRRAHDLGNRDANLLTKHLSPLGSKMQ